MPHDEKHIMPGSVCYTLEVSRTPKTERMIIFWLYFFIAAQIAQIAQLMLFRCHEQGNFGNNIQVVFLYCCPDCPSCPASAIQMSRATLSILAATKKYSLRYEFLYMYEGVNVESEVCER